jgi:glycosyltransferase involved in cell wall biosynthesis
MHFDYKYADSHGELFKGLTLPKGWEFKSLAGLTDEEIQVALRTGAVFFAANKNEGMCAPASEAIISGAVNVCWPGGPTGQTEIGGPMEYLNEGRGVIAKQDDLEDLRVKIRQTVKDVNDNPEKWAEKTAEWSEWFQGVYSIDREHAEICEIMTGQIYLPRAIDLAPGRKVQVRLVGR